MGTMSAAAALTPSVSWAQREKIVFVTINVSDVKDPDIKVEKDSLHFKGTGSADQKLYEVNMKLLKEIDPEKTKYQVRPRCIEFALEKVEEGPYWERLLETRPSSTGSRSTSASGRTRMTLTRRLVAVTWRT